MRKAAPLKKACAEWAFPIAFMAVFRFYQRKEIKDFLAYLRVIVNPRDEEALKRIINYPIRGIGKTTIEKIVIYANEQNITMFDVLEYAGSAYGIKGGTLEVIQNFVTMIKYFQSMLQNNNAYDSGAAGRQAYRPGKRTV